MPMLTTCVVCVVAPTPVVAKGVSDDPADWNGFVQVDGILPNLSVRSSFDSSQARKSRSTGGSKPRTAQLAQFDSVRIGCS
jgi:hypothetical protein